MATRWNEVRRHWAHAERGRVGYALAPLGVALVSLVIVLIHARVAIANLSILYLLVILALASTVGRGPALLAAFLAFLTYNFLFIEPRYTFAINEPAEWLALLIFLLTALVAGGLAAALRERAEEARSRAYITATLYALTRALVAKQEPERLLAAVTEQVVAVFGVRDCVALLPDAVGRLRPLQAHEGDATVPVALADDEAAFVDGVFTPHHGPEPERYGARLYVPLQTAGRRLGVLRIDGVAGTPLAADADNQLLATFAAQAALALEQARLAGEEARAAILARSDTLKDALLSSVSHDLRTPLAAIRAAAGSLLEDIDWAPATRREFATVIDEEAQQLNRLVGALLDVTRIDAGALHSRKELYPLDALIRAVVARVAGLPAATGHRISVELPPDLPPVPLDPVQIEHVLTNLLENGLKYGGAGAPVTVTASATAADVSVSVRDRGPGIPLAERERVFAKFHRLEPQVAPGSGLGLTIARGLIEAHGGRIWIDDAPGGGARVTFVLPLMPDAPPSATTAPLADGQVSGPLRAAYLDSQAGER